MNGPGVAGEWHRSGPTGADGPLAAGRRFRPEQDLLRRLASESILPVLELDTSDGDLDAACEAIADWMTATGGLWPRGHAPAG
jgi:hypothetical protein